MFVIRLSPPGSGKLPAFQNGCSQPIRLHVEEQSKNPIFLNKFNEVGLFRQRQVNSGNKAIIGQEEVSLFFGQILGVKEKCKLDVEPLIWASCGQLIINYSYELGFSVPQNAVIHF